MKLIIVFILSLTTWIYPVKVVSAQFEQPNPHEQILRNNSQPTITQTLPAKSNPINKSTTNVHVSQSTAYNGRNYSKEEVQELIRDYSREYKIESDTPLCIARLESGFNQFSASKSSSARGVFQYLSGTWKATDEGKIGLSVFDADANVRAAVKYMGVHKNTSPWVVGPKCPPLKFIN